MKKNVLILSVLVIVCLLTGCFTSNFSNSMTNSSNSSNPGSVLGLAQDESGSKKTVTFYVVGKGVEPESALTKGEAVLMAERASVADGYRQFAEKIHGVYVDAYMKSGYGTVNHETIKTHTQSWLRGVEIIEIKQANHGITEARMQLRINFSKRGMIWWPNGIGADVAPS